VLTAAVGIVLVVGVLAFLALAGASHILGVIALITGIVIGAGLASLARSLTGILLTILIVLVLVASQLFLRLELGSMYIGIAVGFMTMRLTWLLQKRK
jgi:hypothetical protein